MASRQYKQQEEVVEIGEETNNESKWELCVRTKQCTLPHARRAPITTARQLRVITRAETGVEKRQQVAYNVRTVCGTLLQQHAPQE